MSTSVEKRALSLEEIDAQTALVLPERELMWHHKHHHHHHHHHQQQVQIVIVCVNNHDHEEMNNNDMDSDDVMGGNEENEFENNGCFPISPFSPFDQPIF